MYKRFSSKNSVANFRYRTCRKVIKNSFGFHVKSNATQLISPDTGTASQTYDASANLHTRTLDTQGRLVRYPLGALVRDVSYDAAGRIVQYDHYLTDSTTGSATASTTGSASSTTLGVPAPQWDQLFAYDGLSRLTQASLAPTTNSATSWAYSYDPNGNRTQVILSANLSTTPTSVVSNYTTDPTSNRLLQINNPALTLTHNAAGNITSDGQFSLAYDLRGRLVSVTPGAGDGTGSTQYTHDNAGQRIRKFATGSQIGATGTPDTVLFAYDQNGQLLGEYDSTGAAIREYAWLGNLPIAVFMPDPAQGASANTADPQVFYVHADHLNTPRVVTDKTGTPRWRWLAEPFGTTAPETSPAGAPMFAFNLRFPGQFFDAETGMFYNYQRDYVPGVGRYAQSDPIGLGGGVNTFRYVGGNPVSGEDPLGLVRRTVDLGHGFQGGIDTFDVNGQSSFEIHVFDKKGKEVGLYGPDGWFDKHGKTGRPAGLPDSVEAQCKGQAIDTGRRMGRVPAKGAGDVTGNKWKRFFGKLPLLEPLIELTQPSPERACAINPFAEFCQ